MRIEVADSIDQISTKSFKTCCTSLAKDIYSLVYLISCNQLPNSYDNSFYADVNAMEFLAEDDNPVTFYKNYKMRQYLIESYKKLVLLLLKS